MSEWWRMYNDWDCFRFIALNGEFTEDYIISLPDAKLDTLISDALTSDPTMFNQEVVWKEILEQRSDKRKSVQSK